MQTCAIASSVIEKKGKRLVSAWLLRGGSKLTTSLCRRDVEGDLELAIERVQHAICEAPQEKENSDKGDRHN